MTTPGDKDRYLIGLDRSRSSLMGRFRSIFGQGAQIGRDQLEELEEALIQADVGMDYTVRIVEELGQVLGRQRAWTQEDIRGFLTAIIARAVGVGGRRRGMLSLLEGDAGGGSRQGKGTEVVLVVGVNGTGKTTTIGKLAHRFRKRGLRVLLAAGDTYRAAAEEQLEIWAERSGSLYHRGSEGADPASVVHDALSIALSGSVDVALVDTAGRLHTKEPLMRELAKIMKVASRVVEGAPHEVVLVLDATTGQNALVQARTFLETVGVTAVILTKMDGTAKGGILIPIAGELGLPISYVGLGEGLDDLVPFDPQAYAEALIGGDD
ncbi:MAG: signal recognition particle-docking protein FtsY [bacterium]|nr:MAG: signal recognition particle-docking protein FtsY [bacterium]